MDNHLNRFLLCTLVCGAARGIKARATQRGEKAPVMTIARNVLRSYLTAPTDQPEAESELVPDLSGLRRDGGPLNEEAMFRAIDRQFQAVLKQAQAQRAEERRLDFESIVTAVEARRKR